MTFGHYLRPPLRLMRLLLREFLFLTRVWTPRIGGELDKSVLEFIDANKPYWPKRVLEQSEGVLIEGHLSEYGPNYLLRTAVAAQALREKKGYHLTVVFNGFSHQWMMARRIYESFGIKNSIYLGSRFLFFNLIFFCVSRFYANWCRRRLNSPKDILSLTFGRIKVGDLIYDDVIRGADIKTIKSVDALVTQAIAKSFYFYLQYDRLFRSRLYAYYIATHTAYSEYGLLCRVALAHHVKVVETTDIQMSFYDEISDDNLPTYHEGIKNSVLLDLGDSRHDLAFLREDARNSLQQRLDAKVEQLDVLKAYGGKVYTRAELEKILGIGSQMKIVFVLAHVFSDAPHLSSGMLYADYYRWLSTTLDICARSKEVSWVIKAHPSSAIYGESGLVEKMVADVNSENVIMCPDDLNTKSLSLCADALVTVHGTAGLEFACLGIPVVLAGRPFYSGFGFSIEPNSVEDYEAALLVLGDVAPLSVEQIDKALEVYGIWNRQFDWHNPIITPGVLANVWGSGTPRDLVSAYRLITENLRLNDPRQLKLWRFVQGIAG